MVIKMYLAVDSIEVSYFDFSNSFDKVALQKKIFKVSDNLYDFLVFVRNLLEKCRSKSLYRVHAMRCFITNSLKDAIKFVQSSSLRHNCFFELDLDTLYVAIEEDQKALLLSWMKNYKGEKDVVWILGKKYYLSQLKGLSIEDAFRSIEDSFRGFLR